MYKFKNTLLIIVVLLLVLPFSAVNAQGPAGDWVSSFYCLNQDPVNAANISLAFYQENNGTAALTFSDTIPAGKAKNYYTPTSPAGVPDPFLGSVVVSSSTPLSCSVQNYSTAVGTQGDPFRLATSGGFDSGTASPVVYLSQVHKNFDSGAYGFYQSYIAIQNTSTSTADVTIEYTDRFTGLDVDATQVLSIPGQSTRVVYLETNTLLSDSFLGSAKIHSNDGTTPLAVQATIYNDASSHTKAQFALYNGTPTGESKLFVPYIMRNFYDFNGGITVVNVGTTATSFKITYSIGRTTVNEYVYQHPTELAPGALAAFYMPGVTALAPVDALAMSERAGSAVIQATDLAGNPTSGLLIANANFRNDGNDPTNPNFGGQSATFNTVGSGQVSQTMYIPNLQNLVGSAQFVSGVTIQNATATAGSCTFNFIDDPTVSWTQPLPANGIYALFAPVIADLDIGYSSGVIVTCTVDALAITNLRANAAGYWGDSASSLNALIP